jgi:hypothetical protein
MILASVGGLLLTAFRSPSGKINGPFYKAGDDKTGSYETQPSPLHPKSHRLGSRHTLSVEVTQAVELLLGLRNAKPGPDSWQKRITVNFEDERTD